MNLINDPWIPVQRLDGTIEQAGLRRLIRESHNFVGIVAEAPIVDVALLRLVLAVVLDACGAPLSVAEYRDRWSSKGYDSTEWSSYFEHVQPRFELFDEVAPFAQVAALRTGSDQTKSVSELLPHVPSGNNVPLFGVRTDAEPPRLTPAEAARWLLTAHGYDTAGIKPGAVGDPEVKNGKYTARLAPLGGIGAVVPIGRNLFETLMLNTPIVPGGRSVLGEPWWNKPPTDGTWEIRPAEGVLDLLTFQARRIRLVPTRFDDGEVFVDNIVLTSGDQLVMVPEFEPHAIWRAPKNPKPDSPSMRPIAHQSNKSAWQGLISLLSLSEPVSPGDEQTSTLLRQLGNLVENDVIPEDYPLQLLTVGVEYGNMQAIVENMISDSLPLSVVALRQDEEVAEFLTELVASVNLIAMAVNGVDRDVRSIYGAEAIPWDKGQRLSAELIHEVDPVVRRILAGLQQDPEKVEGARSIWNVSVRRIASAIVDRRLQTVPLSAHAGRVEASDLRVSTIQTSFRFRLKKALEPFETVDEIKETV